VQYAKENPHNHLGDLPPAVKLQENDDDIITEEAVWTSVKRAVNRVCNLQAHDGHWPADYGGLLFLMPGLVPAPTCSPPLITHASQGTHNADSIKESKVIYYLEQYGLRV